MHIGDWWFLGMHMFWWLFWILLIIGLVSLFTPVPKREAKQRATPLNLLQRRYAAGEISTEEYEQRPGVPSERRTAAGRTRCRSA